MGGRKPRPSRPFAWNKRCFCSALLRGETVCPAHSFLKVASPWRRAFTQQQLHPFCTWDHLAWRLDSRCLELTPAHMALILDAQSRCCAESSLSCRLTAPRTARQIKVCVPACGDGAGWRQMVGLLLVQLSSSGSQARSLCLKVPQNTVFD